MTLATPVQEPHVPQEISGFVESLERLSRGDKAVLRRNAGRTLADSRQAWAIFYRLLPPTVQRDREIYFLVATIHSLNDRAEEGNFGATMRRLGDQMGRDSFDRRIAILLDSSFDLVERRYPGGGEMAYRLPQLVKLAASKQVGVNWATLLSDLCWWSHPEKKVQKRWAATYFQKTRDSAELPANKEEGE